MLVSSKMWQLPTAKPHNSIAITVLMLMVVCIINVPYVASLTANHDDPLGCAAKNYTGECCYTAAQPLPLGITECAPGFYCPWLSASDTFIAACPPTPVCQLQRLSSTQCPAPQGKHEPILCPEGQLCATPASMELCPAGYFCPPGTHTPKDCGPMSYCPEGTSRRVYLGAILICALADLLLFIIVMVYRLLRKRAQSLHLRQMKHTGVEASMISTGHEVHALPRPTRKLCRGFNKAKGELREMDFVFQNLSMRLPTGQTILQGVTGQVKPGKVTAIMGPSGAGKTTFLYTMTGKMDAKCIRGGDLTINGQQAELSAFKKVVGYVPQDDVMMRELSVWDNIIHSARVRLPHWSKSEVEGHVRAVIEAMGLVDVSGIKIGDETSRGISGGQRKRVNIGMELAAAPLALFLDEPTSGLDATAAMDVCNLLRDIAQETGITVAMVIHQPRVEIWNHLDDLLLLAPGGKTVFLGPQSKAQRYFESHLAVEVHAHENPADVIMDAIAQSGDSFAKQWVSTGRDYLATMPAVAVIPATKPLHTDDTKNLHGHKSSAVSVARGSVPAAARYEAGIASSGHTSQAWRADGSESDVLESPALTGAAAAAAAHPFAVPSSNTTNATNGSGSRPTTPARRTPATTVNGASGPVSELGNGGLSSRLNAPHGSITSAVSPTLAPVPASGTGGTNNGTATTGGVSPRTITSTVMTDATPAVIIPQAQRTNSSGTPTLGTAHIHGALSPRTRNNNGSTRVSMNNNTHNSDEKQAPSPTQGRPGFTSSTSPKEGQIVGSDNNHNKPNGHVGRHGRKESQVVIVRREPRGAPFLQQFWLCHIRSLKQQHEKLGALVLESGVAMFAGFLMGVGGGTPHKGILIAPYSILSPAPLEFLIPQMCMFVNMSIGLAASSAGVKAFGEERVVYWREAGAGHSPTAYFLGVATASFYRIALSALHFSMVYHLLSAPLIGFGELVLLTTLVFYTVYGLSAIVSMVLKRENAPLLAVVISLFAAVFGGYVQSLPEFLKKISYAYWSSEAMYTKSVAPFRGIYQVDEISAPLWGYRLDHFSEDMLLVFCIGTIYRIAAFGLMIGLNRDKQR